MPKTDCLFKVLALVDSPTSGTGFGRVGKNILERFQADPRVQVEVWALHFDGLGYDTTPLKLYPGGSADWNSARRLGQFLHRLATGGYTHVWLLMDADGLSVMDFPARLRKVCREKRIRSLLYYPVDAPLERDWLTILDAVDVAATYTEYGRTQTRKALAKSLYPVEVVPHGVDPVFRPLSLPQRREFRKVEVEHGGQLIDFIKPDDFLMLNVNKNEWRKDPLRSLEILKGLVAVGVPAKLILRMHPDSARGGIHLELAARQLGLTYGKEWCHIAALDDEGLCGLYNAADVYLTTSLGEGWGLGVTEAMACHCPVAMPGHTSLLEIGELGNVIFLPLETDYVCGADTRLRRRVNVPGAVGYLESYATCKDVRYAPGDRFYRELNWDVIAARMFNLLTHDVLEVKA